LKNPLFSVARNFRAASACLQIVPPNESSLSERWRD
jgi:hypothetical protein